MDDTYTKAVYVCSFMSQSRLSNPCAIIQSRALQKNISTYLGSSYNDALGHKLNCSFSTLHYIRNLFDWIKRKVMDGSFVVKNTVDYTHKRVKGHIKDTHARDQPPQLVSQITII